MRVETGQKLLRIAAIALFVITGLTFVSTLAYNYFWLCLSGPNLIPSVVGAPIFYSLGGIVAQWIGMLPSIALGLLVLRWSKNREYGFRLLILGIIGWVLQFFSTTNVVVLDFMYGYLGLDGMQVSIALSLINIKFLVICILIIIGGAMLLAGSRDGQGVRGVSTPTDSSMGGGSNSFHSTLPSQAVGQAGSYAGFGNTLSAQAAGSYVAPGSQPNVSGGNTAGLCANCGTALKEGDLFCISCGAAVKQ